jgi:hypothetical protein
MSRSSGCAILVGMRRKSLAERREAKRAAKKPRTQPVPHPFLLPIATVKPT